MGAVAIPKKNPVGRPKKKNPVGRPTKKNAIKAGELQPGLCHFAFIAEKSQVEYIKKTAVKLNIPIKAFLKTVLEDGFKSHNRMLEHKLLSMRLEGESIRDIAEKMQVSPSQACRLVNNALDNLREEAMVLNIVLEKLNKTT